MSLSGRAVRSSLWLTVAQGLAMAILAARTIVLARLLPLEAFGVYALAATLVAIAAVVARWGMDGALLHRGEATADADAAAPVHFTLQLLLTVAVFGTGAVLAVGLARGPLLAALLALAAARVLQAPTYTPRTLLQREVAHARLALLQVLQAAIGTALAITLALNGATVWALLVIDLAAAMLACAVLYGWRPVFRPRLAWHPPTVRYLLGFGSRNLLGQLLEQAWPRVDKLVVVALLGPVALGLYARAYGYAVELNALAYRPLAPVVLGSLAALAQDRMRLSSAFERMVSALLRVSFALAGLAALLAPELVPLVLGTKWQAMVPALQLLAVVLALTPLTVAINSLAIAVGRPQWPMRFHLLRLSVLLVGLALLAPQAGIVGAATAAALGVLAGLVIAVRFARHHLDIDWRRLLVAPLVALAGGMLAGLSVALALPVVSWQLAVAKLVVFAAAYAAVLFILEGRELLALVRWLRRTYAGIA